MSIRIREQYTPNPRKKAKKGGPLKEGQFLKRTYEWLKWRLVQTGDVSFHKPCLEE
jgi:hypothetical protein